MSTKWKPFKSNLELDSKSEVQKLAPDVLVERPKILPVIDKNAIVFVENGNVIWVEDTIVYIIGNSKKGHHPITFQGCEIFQHD